MVQPIGAEEAVIEFHMERSREIVHLRTALFQVEDVLMLRRKAWWKQPCWDSPREIVPLKTIYVKGTVS
jgi:hypothetical protein